MGLHVLITFLSRWITFIREILCWWYCYNYEEVQEWPFLISQRFFLYSSHQFIIALSKWRYFKRVPYKLKYEYSPLVEYLSHFASHNWILHTNVMSIKLCWIFNLFSSKQKRTVECQFFRVNWLSASTLIYWDSIITSKPTGLDLSGWGVCERYRK